MQANPFVACSACACYVKREASGCPFCGAAIVTRAVRAVARARMSRGQWLAFGSIALAGCSGAIDSRPLDGGTTGESDAATAPADARLGEGGIAPHEASAAPIDGRGTEPIDGSLLADGAGSACPLRTGTFTCAGASVCDRHNQACLMSQCVSYGELPTVQAPDAASCGPCPTCDCLMGMLGGSCSCTDDGMGGITVSCHACYGSPPARLERLV
jgi:hypothetical protein